MRAGDGVETALSGSTKRVRPASGARSIDGVSVFSTATAAGTRRVAFVGVAVFAVVVFASSSSAPASSPSPLARVAAIVSSTRSTPCAFTSAAIARAREVSCRYS
eukprot:29844-Pelagococcus_subviridis.AAC.6